MEVASERVAPVVAQRKPIEPITLNAQQVTSIAMAFLKSLGHRRGIKPKRVFIEEQRYVVETEIGKKLLAKVEIDKVTSEIREYSIEKKTEESPVTLPVEPRAMLLMLGISIIVSLLFAVLNLQAVFSGLF